MYTYRILYSYKQGKSTRYTLSYLSIPSNYDVQAGEQRVRELFSRHFEGSTLLAVRFAYYENYIVRDRNKLSSERALDVMKDWLAAQAQEESK